MRAPGDSPNTENGSTNFREAAVAGRIHNIIRAFLDNSSTGGLLLIAAAALALVVANSPFSAAYFDALHLYLGPLSLQHWVNDALMTVFFLMVGLEIKREMVDGHLASWSRRVLPGAAAVAGMVVPAAIYLLFTRGSGATHGWAIPSATDIAFALAVISLLGQRVPTSLKVFLAALAIIDDLGAVIVIAIFYTAGVSVTDLALAGLIFAVLLVVNRAGVQHLLVYLLLGVALWIFTYRSGVHATIAGVLLALSIPIKRTPATPEAHPDESPLHRLEGALIKPVAFIIIPIFGFANAGVNFSQLGVDALTGPVTLGVASGLAIGKVLGIFGIVAILVRCGYTSLPAGAGWMQVLGVAFLCGIGFTMSLFISLLAFDDAALQNQAKMGILFGSLVAGCLGYVILRTAKRGDGRDPV
nr:Na+/H+ antiporter NhaA [Pseudochelatococcus contaminans]